MEKITSQVKEVVAELYSVEVDFSVSRTELRFGDLACNVAMILAKKLSRNSREIAEEISSKLRKSDELSEVVVAGPGFINIKFSDDYFFKILDDIQNQGDNFGSNNLMEGKCVVIEYLDPNPFKELHIGHAYAGTVGDSIACLYKLSGADVHRVTYQGDVGLHVAKAMYSILSKVENNPEKMDCIPEDDRVAFLGQSYADGAAAYDEDELARHAIHEINRKIYDKEDATLQRIYDQGRAWSLEYFHSVYDRLHFTPFEKNYFESQTAKPGTELVLSHIQDGVFEQSDGAVVFRGEKYGLHTRVFISSKGIPMYDAKDLALVTLKKVDYEYDQSVIITANEQTPYFEVMLMALEQFEPELAKKTVHIGHGEVRLPSGKMSSRTGKVIRAIDVLDDLEKLVQDEAPESPAIKASALAAMKYAFLKNRIGGNIAFDLKESISLDGNSGPYLQYSYARAQSILSKATTGTMTYNLGLEERTLIRKIIEYPEIIKEAYQDKMPHHICTYLFDLAQEFNRFYEKNRVIGDEREQLRARLISAYAQILKNGLLALGIQAPEKM